MPQARSRRRSTPSPTQQISNQFGTQRYALFFKPGTYGTAAAPLNFQVGYYTQVAGLGSEPGDVTINGSVDVLQPVLRRPTTASRWTTSGARCRT